MSCERMEETGFGCSYMWMLTQPRMVSYDGEEAGQPGVKVLCE